MIRVRVQTVDGGLKEWDEEDAFVERLRRLRRLGFDGKSLVHTLITDDWGAPPTHIRVEGRLQDGSTVKESITYE